MASAGGMPACMSCVMTKKTLTHFLFFEVLSHNVGHWNHVLFMGLSLVGTLVMWIFVCVLQSIHNQEGEFSQQKADSTPHMVSKLFFGEIMEFTRS